jgi:hypothetical protein
MTRWLPTTLLALILVAAPASAQERGRSADRGEVELGSADAAGTAEQAGPALARPIAEAAENAYLRRNLQRGRRPAALPALYASLAGLNALDVYSTSRALDNGAREVNPLAAPAAGHAGMSLAIKAASAVTSIYFAEKLWKKNRAGAVVTMIVVNAATAAVVAHNFRNAR